MMGRFVPLLHALWEMSGCLHFPLWALELPSDAKCHKRFDRGEIPSDEIPFDVLHRVVEPLNVGVIIMAFVMSTYGTG